MKLIVVKMSNFVSYVYAENHAAETRRYMYAVLIS